MYYQGIFYLKIEFLLFGTDVREKQKVEMSRQVQDDVKDNVQVQDDVKDNVQDNVQDKKKKAVTLSNFFVSTKERATVNRAMVNRAMVNSVSAKVNSAMDKGNSEDCLLMSKKRKRMTDEEAEALAEADMQALLKAQEPDEQVPALLEPDEHEPASHEPASLEPASLEPALLEPASLEDDVISFGVTRAECEGCQLLAKGLGGENQASHACLGF
jgi:hypothetical protein